MKNLILVLFLVGFVGCQSPVAHKDKPEPPIITPETYTPPVFDGTKSTRVLRYPPGKVGADYRGAIAQADPLYDQCNVPGTVYVFYDDQALVEYTPDDGTYTMFSLAVKGDVERHNYQEPTKLWDLKTVSAPGIVHDFSHDPPAKLLTIRFLNNAGELVSHPSVPGYFYDNTFSLEDYQTYVGPDGYPKALIRGDFEGWGANDGHTVIHMQLGGDGVSIPAANFHF